MQVSEQGELQATRDGFTAEQTSIANELKAARVEHRKAAKAAADVREQLGRVQGELTQLLQVRRPRWCAVQWGGRRMAQRPCKDALLRLHALLRHRPCIAASNLILFITLSLLFSLLSPLFSH